MKKKDFLSMLMERLKSNFDLFEGQEICGMKHDMTGSYRERVSRYMISPKQEIYAYQSHDHILYRHFAEMPSKLDVGNLRSWIDQYLSEIICINSEHMSSVITIIWSSDKPIEDSTAKEIKRFRYYKSLMLGLKGWVNVKIVHVELSANRITTNRLGRDMVKLVSPSPEWRDRSA